MLAACAAGLTAYWALFYLPVWRGRRYVGWDLTSFNLPLDRYVFEHLHWLSWPLYDPYTYNGIDFAGNIQSGMFYPPKLLMFLGLKATGRPLGTGTYELFLLLHVLLFSLLTCFVVRRLSGSAWLGLFAAVTLTYAGFFQGQLEHLWYFTTLAWAPLALNELHRAVVGGRRSGYVGYAAATLCMLLAGYPLLFVVLQAFVIVFVAVAALAGEARITRTTVRDVIATWVVVALLSAPVVVPFVMLVRHSVADLSMPNLAPRALATAWLPRALGDPANEHLAGTDVTNGYYFAGPLFYLAPLALAVLAIRRRPTSTKYLLALVAGITVLGIAVFTPLIQDTLHVSALRSWTLAGCFFALVAVAVLVAAFELQRRAPVAVRIGAALMTVIAGVLLIGFNQPGGFNTLAGRWDDPAHGTLQLGSPPVWAQIRGNSPVFAILSDPGTLRGKPDTWPRVVGVRNFGGFDPTAPTAYLETMQQLGRVGDGSRSRLVTINRAPDLDWLADNGLRYVVTKSTHLPTGDPRLHLLYRGHSYDIYELTNARPLLSTDGCAHISNVVLRPNVLAFDADTTTPDCEVRTTTNYASGWRAQDSAIHLRAVDGGLGFTIGPLQPGAHHVAIRYRSTPLLVGFVLFLVGIVACVATAAVMLLRRRRRASGAALPRTA